MSSEAPGGSGKTIVLVVGIIALVVVLVVAVCGGVFFLAYRGFSQAMSTVFQMAQDVQASTELAQTFLNEVGAGQTEAAYERTSQAYRKRVSPDEFKALADKHPALKGSSFSNFADMSPPAPGTDKATFKAMVAGPEGDAVCSLMLVKEGGSWAVDSFTVGKPGAGDARSSHRVALDFFKDLSAGQFDRAYEQTSADYRAGHKPADLRALVEANPGFKQFTKHTIKAADAAELDEAKLAVTLTGPNGDVACTVQLGKDDNDEWKVEAITVP